MERTETAALSPRCVLVALLLLAGTAANLFGPQPFVGLPLLAAAPLVAGAMLPLRGTVAAAAVALVVTTALDLYNSRSLVSLLIDMATVAVTGALAVAVNRLLARERRHLACQGRSRGSTASGGT